MTNFSFIQCIWAFILLLIPCYVLYAFNLKIMAKAVRAFIKMAVSLTVVGALVYEVFAIKHIAVTILFALLMILVASVLTIHRAQLKLKQLFLPVMSGTLVGVLLVGLYVVWLVMGVANPLDVRYFIPVIGLLTGHLIQVNSRALHIYYMGLRHHAQLYHYLLGNGATHTQALRYLLRRAIERSAKPNIFSMGWMFVGISPIILWSMALSGVSVVVAVCIQLVLILAMFTSSLLAIIVTVAVSRRYLLDDYSKQKGDEYKEEVRAQEEDNQPEIQNEENAQKL